MWRALAIFLLALLAGCASDDQWTFSASRHVYEDANWRPRPRSDPRPGSEEAEAVGVLLLIALPLTLDLVALPVTLPHDPPTTWWS